VHLHAVGGKAALIAFLRTLGARAGAAVGAPRRAPELAAAPVDAAEEGDAAGADESDALAAANTDGDAQAEAESAQDDATTAEGVARRSERASAVLEPTVPRQVLVIAC
jgi:hypothetical protein